MTFTIAVMSLIRNVTSGCPTALSSAPLKSCTVSTGPIRNRNRRHRPARGPLRAEDEHDRLGRDQRQADVAGQDDDGQCAGDARVRATHPVAVVLEAREDGEGELARRVDEQYLAGVEDAVRDGVEAERRQTEEGADQQTVDVAAEEVEQVAGDDVDAESEQLTGNRRVRNGIRAATG